MYKRKITNDKYIDKLMATKAITLIALIITIIVLLILAAVTLNMVIRRKWNNSKSTE